MNSLVVNQYCRWGHLEQRDPSLVIHCLTLNGAAADYNGRFRLLSDPGFLL